jgi:hypothetical protein
MAHQDFRQRLSEKRFTRTCWTDEQDVAFSISTSQRDPVERLSEESAGGAAWSTRLKDCAPQPKGSSSRPPSDHIGVKGSADFGRLEREYSMTAGASR